MDNSFSAMNVAIYVAFAFLFALWTISVLFRRYRNYYPTSGVMLPQPNIVVGFPANQEQPRGLDVSVIETFPKFPYSGPSSGPSEKSNMKMSDECGVCLGVFQEKEALRMLPMCGHVFHADCVDPWLRSHATCPLCRASLLPDHLPGEMASRAEFRVHIDQGRG